ncbi:MAG TPA: DoxX family protein [Gemmatimonadaceae bacterium]|jgi:putative oxidoreductase|nr:DoxX family protein [Gemmatimonadaceae bacterium]
MTSIAVVPTQRMSLGLTILRVIVGVVFIVHGAQKLFVFGIPGVTAAFGQMHIPLAAISAPGVAILEFVGGIALVIGLFTRIFALLLAIDMLGAILFVHGRNGFFLPTGYEFALTLIGAFVALAVGGPGEYSVDNRRR